MMMSGELDRVKQWLLSKWSISAPSDWLHACLDWLHEDAQESLSATDVNEHVYEQWLLSDLRQIGAACLPGDLPETQKTDLRGCFCLQMNSVVDVSTSYYSQLQKLQGTDNENVHVTATQFTQTQVKSNRVLMMKMTDGSVEVQGMEYQPISCLHSGLSPGVKMQIRGPVLCRLGVLMLKKDNVRILGGEVEELVTENSPQLLLQRALNQESREGQTAPQRRQPPSLGVSEGGNSVQGRSGSRRSTRGIDDCGDEHVAVPRKRMRRSSTERAVDASLDGLSAELLDAMDEEWDSDDLMDDFVQQGHMNVNATTTSHDEGHMTSTSMTNINSSNTELGEYGRHNRPSPVQLEPSPRQQINTTLQRDAVKWPRVIPSGSNYTDSHATKFKSEPFQDFHSDNPKLQPTATKTTGETSDGNDSTMSEDVIDLTQTETSCEYNHNSSVREHIPPCETETVSSAFTARSVVPVDGATISAATSHLTSYEMSPPVAKERCRYTYLSEIHWPPTQTHEVHIKAYVSTLVSKLDHGGGSRWSLRVKLNDGSAVMDCDLANELLTSLIGFSASESLKMKQIAKKDKGVRKHLMEGLMQCQQSLIQMSCIMVLQLDPDRPRPFVLRYRAPTVQDWEDLQERIS